jgi:hypothetical protein
VLGRANALYFLTPPEFTEILQARYEALLAAIPRDVPLTERRLAMARSFCETSSYARDAIESAGPGALTDRNDAGNPRTRRCRDLVPEARDTLRCQAL